VTASTTLDCIAPASHTHARCAWSFAGALCTGFVFSLSAAGTGSAADAGWANPPVNRWVKLSPLPDKPAPPFGWEGSGAYDPWSRLWIHYGGHDGIPQGFALFTFDPAGATWKQRFADTSPPGVCCVDGGNAFDVANRRLVRFPGASLGHGYQWSRGVKLKSAHVWLYDPAANTWTNMRPPPYRPFLAKEGLGSLNPTATYDPNHELALSFGGQSSSGGTNNLFAYDAYANRLYRLDAAGPPAPRDGNALAYDAKNDCLVMFGSQYLSDEETWIYRYETGAWQAHDLEPHPPGKKLGTYSTIPRMAYDSVNEICLCVTWDTDTGAHQTWAFDTAKLRWTKMNPSAEAAPSMSRSRNLSFLPEQNIFLLETSSKEAKGRGPEIWMYRYGQRPASTGPSPPQDLQVVTSKGTARLTWSGASPGIKEYHVYRAEADEPWKANLKKVAATSQNSFEDRGLMAGRTYFYAVRALDKNGKESGLSFRARTQPRVPVAPQVSVMAADKVLVKWNKHPAPDVAGYNLYRGTALMRTVTKGTPAAWRDNDPEYSEPQPVDVRDIIDIQKLNDQPLSATEFTDSAVSLVSKGAGPAESRYQVYAYIVKAVNRLGTESGPSPYALTIPAEPKNLLCRERGDMAELKWAPNPGQGIAGYHVYKLGPGHWDIKRITDDLVHGTSFTHNAGRNTTRYWVVAVDSLGQEGEPSSPVWYKQSYKGFFEGEWHQ
jgi:hypothetical protein